MLNAQCAMLNDGRIFFITQLNIRDTLLKSVLN